ncbi:FAD-binding oxidoreductase [Nonomuraea typhae]|uniref:FAD-binding oxidoreductase n=1 Tax=Nonomuraea typhae TaxID=2603600 RepID=UPI0012F8D972|nr:FAD-binding oxidoreductase [Nonomuraea typhae]
MTQHIDNSGLVLVEPGDPDYDTLRRGFVYTGTPACIARCRNAAGVAAALAYAQSHGLPVAVRSGGHSGAALSTVDGGMVIDLSPINHVDVLGGPDNLVRLGTGATWGQVAEALAGHGLAISSGDTTSVGVGGLMLGGGIGWMVRKYGLALDSLVAAEVVTADGQILRVSADDHPDLFWAVRGGTGNAAVVTTFEVAAQRESLVTFARIVYPADDLASLLTGWRDALRAAPDELTTFLQIMPGFGEEAPPSVVVLACYAGDDPAALTPLTRLGTPVSVDVDAMPYPKVLDDAFLPDGWRPMVRNRFVRSLDDDLIGELAGRAASIPMMVIELRGLGGAMNRVPAEATAFAHRDTEAMLQIVVLGTPQDHQPIMQDYTDLWNTLAPYTSGAYANFLTEISADDVDAVYPEATRARLAAVKHAYDPDNLFHRTINV